MHSRDFTKISDRIKAPSFVVKLTISSCAQKFNMKLLWSAKSLCINVRAGWNIQTYFFWSAQPLWVALVQIFSDTKVYISSFQDHTCVLSDPNFSLTFKAHALHFSTTSCWGCFLSRRSPTSRFGKEVNSQRHWHRGRYHHQFPSSLFLSLPVANLNHLFMATKDGSKITALSVATKMSTKQMTRSFAPAVDLPAIALLPGVSVTEERPH